MRPQRDSAPPTSIGQGAEKSIEAGNLRHKDSTGLRIEPVGRVFQFRRPNQPRCAACGNHLPWQSTSVVCEKHFAEDMLLHSMSLRRQALGMLALAGG